MIWLQTTCSDLPFYLVPLSFFPFCSLASEGSLWILTQAVFFCLFVCLFLRLVTHSCLTLCNLMNCSPPGSSVHGILQARILEWVPFPSPGNLPEPGIEPGSPALQADSLLFEPPGKVAGSKSVSRSVVSDSLQACELWPASLLCPWNSPGKNTGVGSHSFLQRIFLTTD